MQAFGADTRRDRISIVWLSDPAVAPDPDPPKAPEGRDETEEERAAREAWKPPSEVYSASLNRSALTLTGEPRVYHFRPFTSRETSIVAELFARGLVWASMAHDVMGAMLVEVTGPHPLSEQKIRAAKTRSAETGLPTLPDAVWEDHDVFPPRAVLEVPVLYLGHQGDVTVTAKNS